MWRNFVTLGASSDAWTDRVFANLARRRDVHRSIRQVSLAIDSNGPCRLAIFVVAQLPNLVDLNLGFTDEDVSEHPVEAYLDIIGEASLLERLRIETRREIVVGQLCSPFRALRCLDVFGGSIAQSILDVRGSELVNLRLTLFLN